MAFYGYGEDALTYAALTENLQDILVELGDFTLRDDTVLFFRPSFGRRGARATSRGSSFGEFDGIIGTPVGTYLIESKWSRSGETWGKTRSDSLTLRPEQIRRHKVLRWYIDRWRSSMWPDWSTFRSSNISEFEDRFDRLTIPTDDRTLGQNLLFVLEKLRNCGPVQDLVLFCNIDQFECPVPPEPFHLIVRERKVENVSGFFLIAAGTARSR
jgi:hypothetical protein